MRLVWIVIPLILIVSMIGIVGIHNVDAVPHWTRIGVTDITVIGENDTINVDEQTRINVDYILETYRPIEFALLFQITDDNGEVVMLNWVEGSEDVNMDSDGIVCGDSICRDREGQEKTMNTSWTPLKSGEYHITLFAWESIDNPTALGPPVDRYITVESNATLDLTQCKDNHILVSRVDGSSICVKPLTAEKLIQRGWTINEKITDSLKIPNAERDAKLAAGYKLYPGVGWIHPDDLGNQQPIYVDNPNNHGELILDIDSMLLLQKIMDSCKNLNNEINVRPDMVWSNTTHFINNDVCKWTTISTQCESVHGGWIDEYNECVPRTFPLESCRDGLCQERFENFCSEFNGDYYSCHSGCRHSPDWPNVICAAVCEKVCEFK